MQIKPISNININTINSEKYNQQNKNNTVSNPNFTGFWNFLPKKNSLRYIKLDSDTTIFSPKQLKKLRENVASEISEIITMPATPALKKRLNDLLYSPFADYKTNYFNNTNSLADLISYNVETGSGNDMYRQFITTSLSETMPLELLKGKEFKGITNKYGNNPLKHIFESYHKMNENTPEAVAIRKIVERFKEADIPIENKEYYLAESIVNNQPLMSKTYIDALGIKPNDNINVISNKSAHTEAHFKELVKKFNNPPIMENPVTNTKFFIVNPDKAKNADGSNFYYDSSSEQLTLYKLSGLSKNEDIRNIFDIIPFMNKNLHEFRPLNKKECEQVNEFEHFLVGAQEYHPELASVDFVEKYVKSFADRDLKTSAVLYDYSIIRDNPKFKAELKNKIQLLSATPSEENKKELDLLKEISDYLN